MTYQVPPGLYAVGNPGPHDPVAVTANYKASYDHLRGVLGGRDCWILVLQTYGINVWCAAGKGTFGTGELVRRISSTRLADVVAHRTVIVPLLGAPGIRAVEVRQRTGFSVRFSVIRAADFPAYLDKGLKSTPPMRELTFTLPERLALIPVDTILGLKNSAPLAALFLAAGFAVRDRTRVRDAALAYITGLLAGTVVVPALLPVLPGRSFAVKGAVVGGAAGVVLARTSRETSPAVAAGTVLAVAAVSSFFALNFTGSTPYTSRSGVKKEMRLGLPAMALAAAAGFALLAFGRRR